MNRHGSKCSRDLFVLFLKENLVGTNKDDKNKTVSILEYEFYTIYWGVKIKFSQSVGAYEDIEQAEKADI